jgi:hypothetical protein
MLKRSPALFRSSYFMNAAVECSMTHCLWRKINISLDAITRIRQVYGILTSPITMSHSSSDASPSPTQISSSTHDHGLSCDENVTVSEIPEVHRSVEMHDDIRRRPATRRKITNNLN